MAKKVLVTFVVSLLMLTEAVLAAASLGGRSAEFHDAYRLQKVVVLSRHNIRSPLSRSDSALGRVTPHPWFSWTSAPSELSLKGGQLETIMGQYFCQWLTAENLITKNFVPKEGEVRFYANSKQRTIATARFFSAGMMPMADIIIEHKYAPEGSDMVFSPRFSFMNDAYRAEILSEMSRIYEGQGMERKLAASFQTLEKTLDLKDSPAAKEDGLKHFSPEDMKINVEKGKQPVIRGSSELAFSAAEALILQYYEEPDKTKAGFGHKLTDREWQNIGRIKDIYYDMLLTPPSVSVNVAHGLLQVMREELSMEERKFTFLCGHDTNLTSVLGALGVEDYSLPQAIESKTPIGAKFVIGKWKGKDGREYASLDLVYQSVDQLRNRTSLALDNPPMTYHLKLKDLRQTGEDLYLFSDVMQRLQRALEAYNELPQTDAESASSAPKAVVNG